MTESSPLHSSCRVCEYWGQSRGLGSSNRGRRQHLVGRDVAPERAAARRQVAAFDRSREADSRLGLQPLPQRGDAQLEGQSEVSRTPPLISRSSTLRIHVAFCSVRNGENA